MEQQLATTEQRLATTLQEKDSAQQAHEQKEVECQEVALMLKEIVENSQITADLQIQTKQVY